ncbi:MAG: hypothetical protein JW388_1500 [Nitrospira sp.]|nr:hypothetical protein [Nitrospira sp.]
MERRAASHTEEEEMNHRRKLLNAAKRGDQKAIGKLLDLYQVRIHSGDMVQKLNKTSATHKLQAQLAEGKPVKGGGGSHGKKSAPVKPVPTKAVVVKSVAAKPAPAKAVTAKVKPKAKPKPAPRAKVKPKAKPKAAPRKAVKAARKKHKK